MPPAVVMMPGVSDIHERPPFGTLRFADELHPDLMRQAVAFFGVTGNAGADNVFPSRLSAPVAWVNVIQIEIRALKNQPAVLAGVPVPLEDIMPGELNFLFREALEKQQHNDSGDADVHRYGFDHFGLGIGLRKIAPAHEIMSQKIVSLIGRNHLGVALIKERESPPDRTRVHRLPEAIEHKNRLIENGIHKVCLFCRPPRSRDTRKFGNTLASAALRCQQE